MTDRHALTYVEIDVPVCALRYGETTGAGTCPAVLGVDSDIKCFNTLGTCPVAASYAETEVTLRFAIPTDYLVETGIDAIPIITGIDFSPAIISLGEDLGQRASLTVNFKDVRWSDTGPGFDPYVDERDYNPFSQGTFWGKFRARQPYLRSRNIRVIRGYLGQTLEEMETRHYIIDSFDGPTTDGSYSIIAKDVLKLFSGDRAQCPVLSNGYLAADISSGDAAATLAPAGIGDEEYPASGFLNIGGKEIVSFTRSGDALTITGRGQLGGGDAADHDAEDRVQVVKRIVATGPADIMADYALNYTDTPDSYVNLTSWQTEASAYNARLYTATIAEPTGVDELASELIEQAGLAVWGDDRDRQIRFQVLRPIATDAEAFTDENIIADTLDISEQPDRRISEVQVYYGQINPLEGQDDPSNYRSSVVVADLDAKLNYGSAAIKTIYSRYIPAEGRSAALRICDIQLGRFTIPPRRFVYDVFRIGPESPTLGEGCVIEAGTLQDATGARVQVPIQIVRLNPGATVYTVEADEFRFSATSDDPSVRDLTYDSSVNGVSLLASHNLLYPAPVGGETINAYIEEGAVLGATAYGEPALDVGDTSDWPTITFSGGRTSASAIVTVADTSAFKVGMAVSGAGFTGYPRILSIVANTSITLDANSSASGSTTLTLYTVIINIYVRGRIQGAGGPGGAGAVFVTGPNVRTLAQNGSPGTLALKTRYPLNLFLDEGLAAIFGGGSGGGGAGVLALSNHQGGSGGQGAGVPGASLDSGASGSDSYASFSWSQYPYNTGVRGGPGGAPGEVGGSGGNHGGNAAEQQVGSGGAPGPAIDGASFVKKTGTGDLRGGETN